MDAGTANRSALQEGITYWSEFVSKCISHRLDTDRFEDYVRLIQAKHPLPPAVIADLFLRPQPSNRVSLDPRIPPYMQSLSKIGYVKPPTVLLVLYKYSALHAHTKLAARGEQPKDGDDKSKDDKTQDEKTLRWQDSSWAEETMFYHVIKTVVEGSAFKDAKAGLELVAVICKWMDLFAAVSAKLNADMLAEKQDFRSRDEMETARAAFVPLLLRLVDNMSLLHVLGKPLAKGARKALSESMSNFVQTLQPVPQVVERLEHFRTETLAKLDPVDKKKQAANAAMNELLDSAVGLENFIVPEIPISNTRAGLYVYLNAMLVGRPLVDDPFVFQYLNNRYQGNTQSSAIDLIVASFDVLANAVFRNEGTKDAHILRSYLVNKLPLLLCQLCPPEFSTTSAEFCITEALNRVDTSVFPTASLMFDESRNNSPYTESVREEFCAACALHGLIEREHVDRILGETSMSYDPSLEKASKERLVQDCLADSDKIQGIVGQLEKMDGNVGAAAHAVVALLRQLANSKETMSLKALCTQLAQKPQLLDILLLFERLPTILEPLCRLLDNWRYEEDQGEYQPVYEEFGAVLLLVFAFAYRYNLTPLDMGVQSADSHVGKIISRAHTSRPMDELSEQENGNINGWIKGLFDNETGGLGDDLMSSCPPHEFYLLIAPIFQSIVTAYSYGYLNDESLKGGIEYLVDTFLLPSLVPAIRFLSDYIWIDQKEQKSIVKLLQLLLTPSSISGEASAMLSSVKNLVAAPVEHALRTYQRQDPKNQDIEPLLKSLKDSIPMSRRIGSANHHEMEVWQSSSSTGLSGAIRHTIQGLTQWSLQQGVNMMPTSYTHRQTIAGLRIMGPSRLLRLIIEEIRQQSEMGNGSVAYDVAMAYICAADVTNEPAPPPPGATLLDASANVQQPPQRPLGLREVLKSEAENCKKLQKKDPVLAEMVVRLHRRVETQMVMPPPQAMLQATDMSMDLGGDAMAAAAAAVGVGADSMGVDGGLDMSMAGDLTGDLDLGGSGGADADLFGALDGSLDTSMDMFDGWDSMDLGGT